MRAALGALWLTVGQALAAGCGDVTGDVIVRGEAAPDGCTGDAGPGLCRACQLDAECPPNAARCLASGACAECTGHADCSQGDDDDDDDDDDDGDALFCSASGRCVECLDDGDCDDAGERCNTLIGECAEPCSSSDPCGSDDPICDASTGFCVECRDDLDCGAGELCRGSECAD